MTSGRVVLQGSDGHDLTVTSVVAALGGTFGVRTKARGLVRRARLDTFDRRLRAAGLVLEHERGPSLDRLVLDRPEGSSALTATVAERLRWPALAGLLPASPVRDAVAPVAGIRALMVHSQERRNRSAVELRNDDEKVVVRLELDEPAGATATRSELRVHALRGYDNEARRALRLLTGQGLRPVEGSEEHGPGCGPAPDTGAPATARRLLAQSLGEFLAAMRDNLPGLLGDVDTEFLHDFRVAVRRTRSTLKLGRAALPGVFRDRWEPSFKWLGDLTTPVRDLDVYELGLPEMTSWLVAAAGADLEPFAAHLHRRRAAERRVLVRGLRSERFARLVREWEGALAELAQPAGGGPGEHLSAEALGARSISRAYRRVARGGAAISADSPAEDLHALRKRAKELRYALEVFAPVLEPGPRKRAVSELKTLQDVLGRFQDSEVQRTALRGFAEEMVQQGTPAGAVLAMGELIGHLDAEQARARQDFGGTFAQFVRPSSQRRIRRLGGGG